MKNDELAFFTADLVLAATLLSCGIALQRVDKSNPRRALFFFPKTPQVEETVHKFWARKERIDPIQLNEQTRYLKSLLYQ